MKIMGVGTRKSPGDQSWSLISQMRKQGPEGPCDWQGHGVSQPEGDPSSLMSAPSGLVSKTNKQKKTTAEKEIRNTH